MPSTLINLAERLAAASQGGREQLAAIRSADEALPELHRQMLEHVRHMADQPRPDAGESFPDLSVELAAAQERIAALEEELTAARDVQRTPAPASSRSSLDGISDWEAMKERMLAEGDDESPEERATVQERLEAVERFRHERDEDLRSLQEELEAARRELASAASEDSLMAASLDLDSAIQQERENLLQLQEEWHEKLRQAEVEISVERARMARERTQMEERVRLVEQELEHVQEHGGKKDSAPGAGGGKWLARLGLSREE